MNFFEVSRILIRQIKKNKLKHKRKHKLELILSTKCHINKY